MNINFNISLVLDSDLNKNINKLIKYYNNSNYFKSLVKDKPERNKFTLMGMIGNSYVYLRLTPGRLGFDKMEKTSKRFTEKYGKDCGLVSNIISQKLITPFTKEKNLLWRNYIIKQNAFPYFKTHLLIISTDYNCENPTIRGSQNYLHNNENVIKDMLEFYNLRKQKGFMFFNGLIGNSQNHFHFHYVTDRNSLKNIINTIKTMKYNNFKTKNGTNITIFNSDNCPCYNGTIFYGKLDQISKDIFYFLKKVNKEKYLYNLVIIPSKNIKKYQVIIYIRKHIGKKLDKKLSIAVGANFGYLVLKDIDDEKLKNNILEKNLLEYCKISFLKSKKKYFDL